MSTFTQRINVVDSELVGKAADVCRTELPVFLSRMDCTLNPSNNITDGAVPNVIVVLDDDDDETDYRYTAAHDGGVADHRKDSQETFPMDNENNSLVALSLFSSILPQCSHENAMYWLRKFEWNVEAAIDAALTSNIDIKEIDISCDNKTNQQNHGAPSAKKRSMTDDESHQKVHQRSPNRKLIFDTKDHVSKYNATGSSSDVPTGTNKYTFSVEWQATMERFQSEDPAEHFIDSFFPPTLQSLDGRQRHQHHGSDQNAAGPLNNTRQQQSNRSSSGSSNETTLCHCGYPAAAKRVQSDGPNYGRFYLACGQIQRRRAKVLAIRRSKRFKSDDTDGSPVAPSNAVVDAISISTDVDVTENSVAKGADVILVSNPYAKKSCTIEKPTTPTKATLQRTESSPSSPPTPQRRQCTFFQWDRTGSLGAANNHSQCTRDGYGSILNDDDENGNVRSHRSISWFRFGMEQRCMLFQKHMETSHVRQGAIGDCWFLSALAVVAEKPHLMQRVVPHDGKLNKAGCYQINLYLDGCWKAVVVDSYLPIVLLELDGNKSHSTSGRMTVRDISTRLRDGVPVVVSKASHQVPGKQSAKSISSTSCLALPAFCAAPDRQLWPCLVEKAYAKAHGSYQQLSGGFIAEGLQDLTGAPTETIVFANGLFDPESLWTRLLSFSSAGFLMGVATARGGDGLVGGHAYSVLDVLEIRDVMVGEQPKVSEFFTSKKSPEVVELLKHTKTLNKPKGSVSAMLDSEIDDTPANDMISVPQRGKRASVRLVRIRNPWGKREWKGDWSADSERWTKALRKRLGDGTFAKGDGTFYMSFDDMLQRFHHMDVAKAREGWQHSFAEGRFFSCGSDPLSSSTYMYALSATKTTQAFLTIIQPKKRSNTLSQYWYGDPSMILLRRIKTGSGGHEWECVACFLSGVKRQCHVDVFLEAGSTYFCLPFSCLACRKNNKHGALPFRMATYSSETVSIQSLPIDSDQSLVARNAATKLIHRNLLSKSLLLYPVSRTSMFTCIHGEGSVYFLAVNSSDDNFLSLRLTLDVPDGLLVVFGKEEDTYDVEPTSQRILAVVAGNGKQSLATEFKFRYTSSLVPVASSPLLSSQTGRHSIRRSGNQTPALNGSSHLGSDIVLSMAGDLLTMSSDDSLIQMAGSGTIDTYLWIPQLGASGILKNNFDGSF